MAKKSSKETTHDRSWVDLLTPDEIRALERSPNAQIPTVDGLPFSIPYCDRRPEERILSGPLGTHSGRGHRAASLDAALAWASSCGRYSSARPHPSLNHSQELIDAGIQSTRWYLYVVLVP